MTTLTIQSANSPVYGNPEHTHIHLNVKFEEFPDELPFNAVPTDPEPHGIELYNRAKNEEYGPIAPYVEPENNWSPMSVGKLYTTLAQQDHISRREALKAVADKELPTLMRRAIDDMSEDEAFEAEMHMTASPAFAPVDPILRKVLSALSDEEYKALRKTIK